EMAGTPGVDSVLLQSRLTASSSLTERRDVPGAHGVARFVVDEGTNGSDRTVTPWLKAEPASDYIVRHHLRDLKPGTKYRYRLEFGADEHHIQQGPERWFRTLPDAKSAAPVSFLFFNCM